MLCHQGSHLILLPPCGVSSFIAPSFQTETLHFREARPLVRALFLVTTEPDFIESCFYCFKLLSFQISGTRPQKSGPSLCRLSLKNSNQDACNLKKQLTKRKMVRSPFPYVTTAWSRKAQGRVSTGSRLLMNHLFLDSWGNLA